MTPAGHSYARRGGEPFGAGFREVCQNTVLS
jgi:hypothetical protein